MIFDYEIVGGIFDYSSMTRKIEFMDYDRAWPFPHAIIDNACHPEWLKSAAKKFPDPQGNIGWYVYDNPLEKKKAMPHVERLAYPLRDLVMEMNSSPFIRFLEKLTGIKALIPDPHFNGAGCHCIEPGGYLDVHSDYNYHPETNLHRRVNALLYLNPMWELGWGGELQLRTKDMREYVTIPPLFNRLVVFNITDTAKHGHPSPLRCPDGFYRKSVATYYYTATRPECEMTDKHSTIFLEDPHNPTPELNELRAKRSEGRLK